MGKKKKGVTANAENRRKENLFTENAAKGKIGIKIGPSLWMAVIGGMATFFTQAWLHGQDMTIVLDLFPSLVTAPLYYFIACMLFVKAPGQYKNSLRWARMYTGLGMVSITYSVVVPILAMYSILQVWWA